VHQASYRVLGLATLLGIIGCSGPGDDSGEAGAGGAGGSPSGGSGGMALGGASPTGGTLPSSGGAGATSGGTAPSGGASTGGVAGGLSGGSGPLGGGSGGPATGGTGADGTGGTSTGGGGSPSGGSGGAPSGGSAGAATGGGPVGGGGSGGKATGGAPSGGAGGATLGGDGGVATGGGAGEAAGGASTTTTPGDGCTPPATYANLFVALSGHTQEETDAKIEAAWSQLFNPSNANTVYYDGPGADESYVKDIGNNDVRTEGMSYGMMAAVQLDRQTEFDRLWTWVKNHMAQGTGQIAWQCSTSGSKMSSGGAPDGEEYFATALIFAHNRWGDSGKFNYAEEAQWVLNLIRTTYFNSTYHLVQFVANSGNVDASYVLPAFYQVWACFDAENAAFWNESVTAGREFFHAAADSNGVIGDRQSFTGQTTQGAGSDAKRCVMNIMMDHNFFAADPWQTDTYAPAFGSYLTSHPDNSAAGFSCASLLGFGLPEASGKAFVDKIWSAPIPTGTWRYYDGTLYMLSLLHVSGTFHLWY
jgi:oligosaccharide reducing-end xylanase